MKILGIDPGLTGSGFGCVESRGREYYKLYGDTAAPPAKWPLPERLAAIRTYTLEVLEAVKPEKVAVEMLFSHAEHPKTALQMAQARRRGRPYSNSRRGGSSRPWWARAVPPRTR
jgi:crossover junction endodeoxyribonuclease RuvC